MPYDFKKEQKEFYRPGGKPGLITVPPMQFAAVSGNGDPNVEGGSYKEAVGILYAVAYTIRMASRSGWQIPGFVEFVVPPLESLWWMEGGPLDLSRKEDLQWTAMIRLPDFVTEEVFAEAVSRAAAKKGIDASLPTFLRYDEGECVQGLHTGSYDTEQPTIEALIHFAGETGLVPEDGPRRHHEIYLSDPRRTAPEKRKTVIRLPVRPA